MQMMQLQSMITVVLVALHLSAHVAAQQNYRSRAKRCICFTITPICGCYQRTSGVPSSSYQQPSTTYQQPSTTYQQQPNIYQQPNYSPYQPQPQYESPTQQQSLPIGGGACLEICAPQCNPGCVEQSAQQPSYETQQQVRTTPYSTQPQYNPNYYNEQQQPAAAQQSSSSSGCISVCVPPCESTCMEPTGSGSSSSPADYNTNPRPYPGYPGYPSSSVQSVVQPQAPLTHRIVICIADCGQQQQQLQPQPQPQPEHSTYAPDSETPQEITIDVPQSIKESPDCLRLCDDTCEQQCLALGQPVAQCRPSCTSTCQEICVDAPTVQQQQQSTITTTQNAPISRLLRLRSPPIQTLYQSPQVLSCQPDATGHCQCPTEFVVCLRLSGSGQQCCRKRR